MKHPVISISSDDDDDDNEGNFDEEEEVESEFSPTDDGDDSESDDQDYYEEEEENDAESDEEECFVNRDETSDRFVSFHHGSNDSQEPSLSECKVYLRKHGLRLSGTKEECILRIKEHGRLKEGRGESLYPRSSFSINCTGDACKGDVVLFTQKVYNKFDKASRRGDVVGKRTVAGRIVKESYGASKQQHTFTVRKIKIVGNNYTIVVPGIEVLWSKGPQKLPPLSPLLVKGRNLYRFRTLRQPWKSEAERSKVLGEKHKRGEAARHKRKLKKTDIASKNNQGRKRQKVSSSTRTDKHKSGKKRVNERKAIQFQRTQPKTSQTTFRADPNSFVYSDHHPPPPPHHHHHHHHPPHHPHHHPYNHPHHHPPHHPHHHHHIQQASSSSSSIPYYPTYNLPPLGFPGYHGHYYKNG